MLGIDTTNRTQKGRIVGSPGQRLDTEVSGAGSVEPTDGLGVVVLGLLEGEVPREMKEVGSLLPTGGRGGQDVVGKRQNDGIRADLRRIPDVVEGNKVLQPVDVVPDELLGRAQPGQKVDTGIEKVLVVPASLRRVGIVGVRGGIFDIRERVPERVVIDPIHQAYIISPDGRSIRPYRLLDIREAHPDLLLDGEPGDASEFLGLLESDLVAQVSDLGLASHDGVDRQGNITVTEGGIVRVRKRISVEEPKGIRLGSLVLGLFRKCLDSFCCDTSIGDRIARPGDRLIDIRIDRPYGTIHFCNNLQKIIIDLILV